jgi:hypothetical protein
MHLTVIHPFSREEKDADGKVLDTIAYAKGDKIHDADEVKQVLAGENAGHVVKTADQMMNGSVPQKTDPTKLN